MNIKDIPHTSDEQKQYYDFLLTFLRDLQKHFTEKLDIIREPNSYDFGVSFRFFVNEKDAGVSLHNDTFDSLYYKRGVLYNQVLNDSFRYELLCAMKYEITRYLNESKNNL